jgi:hypothetical protein
MSTITVTITVDTDNATFAHPEYDELRNILTRAVNRIATDTNDPTTLGGNATLRDSNGNTVGRYKWTTA